MQERATQSQGGNTLLPPERNPGLAMHVMLANNIKFHIKPVFTIRNISYVSLARMTVLLTKVSILRLLLAHSLSSLQGQPAKYY